MSFLRRFKSCGWGKRFLLIFGLLIIFLMGLFVYQVAVYYQGIKSGTAFSPSKKMVNSNILMEDLVRLASVYTGTLGKPGAKLTIVEFLDFDCPYSRNSFSPVREMITKYQDQIYFVVRDFPIEELYPRAVPAALAAHCAAAQGKFWPYHDKLFIHQDQHQDEDLMRYAREVGLEEASFQRCYENRMFASAIQQDVRDGLQSGVAGTPTFFFNGVKIQGALDADTLESLIKRFLQ